MKPTDNPNYIEIQERLKANKECNCKRPFKKKVNCGKCRKKLRDEN